MIIDIMLAIAIAGVVCLLTGKMLCGENLREANGEDNT